MTGSRGWRRRLVAAGSHARRDPGLLARCPVGTPPQAAAGVLGIVHQASFSGSGRTSTGLASARRPRRAARDRDRRRVHYRGDQHLRGGLERLIASARSPPRKQGRGLRRSRPKTARCPATRRGRRLAGCSKPGADRPRRTISTSSGASARRRRPPRPPRGAATATRRGARQRPTRRPSRTPTPVRAFDGRHPDAVRRSTGNARQKSSCTTGLHSTFKVAARAQRLTSAGSTTCSITTKRLRSSTASGRRPGADLLGERGPRAPAPPRGRSRVSGRWAAPSPVPSTGRRPNAPAGADRVVGIVHRLLMMPDDGTLQRRSRPVDQRSTSRCRPPGPADRRFVAGGLSSTSRRVDASADVRVAERYSRRRRPAPFGDSRRRRRVRGGG